MKAINRYLDILEIKEEFIQLNEADINKVISMLTPESKTKNLVKRVRSSLNKKDPVKSIKKIKGILSFIPDTTAKKIDSFVTKKFPDFKSFKKLADTILKNSLPEVDNKMRDYASSFLAFSSIIVEKNKKNIGPKENLKTRVKDFVLQTRKFIEDHEPEEENVKIGTFHKEDLPDLAVAWVIIGMTTALVGGLGTGIYLIMSAISAHITAIFFIVLALLYMGAVIKTLALILPGIMGGMG